MLGNISKIMDLGAGGKIGNCKKHGEYERKTQYAGKWLGSCPHCVADDDAQRAVMIDAQRKANAHKAVGDAGIPSILRDASLDSWDFGCGLNQKIKQTIIDFCYREGEFSVGGKTSLLLLGGVGVGKSWAAAAAAMAAISAGEIVVWRTARGLSLDSRAGWVDRTQTQERDYLDAVSSVDLLVIDDVGDKYMSERDYAVTRDILSRRYDSRHRTILTSNHGMGGCKPIMSCFGDLSDESMLGVRVYSRLRQCAKLVGDSYINQKDNRYSF